MQPATHRRRPPPYAQELIRLRRRGLSPTGSLCISTDWNLGKKFAWRVVVPADLDLTLADFRFAAGLDVLLHGSDQARMDAIAREILAFDVIRLIGACTKPPKITVYWPGP